MPPNTHRLRLVLVLTFIAAVLGIAGCGKSGGGAKDSVTGKVSLNGQPVSGQVIFIGSDNKEYGSPIGTEGNYQIIGAPKGEATILVKALGATMTPGPKGPGGKAPEMPGMPATSGATAPPARYGTAAGGLKITITGGEQKHDIELK